MDGSPGMESNVDILRDVNSICDLSHNIEQLQSLSDAKSKLSIEMLQETLDLLPRFTKKLWDFLDQMGQEKQHVFI